MSQQIYSLSRLTASVTPRGLKFVLPKNSWRSTSYKIRACGGGRTHDLRFTKPLLCQLSYTGGDAKTSKYTETRPTRNTKKATIKTRNLLSGSLATDLPISPSPPLPIPNILQPRRSRHGHSLTPQTQFGALAAPSTPNHPFGPRLTLPAQFTQKNFRLAESPYI